MSVSVPSFGMSDQMLAALAPAVAMIEREVRGAVRAVIEPKITRTAQVYVRQHGDDYREGARRIVESISVDPETVRGLSYTRDRDIDCGCCCSECCSCDNDSDD